MSDNRMFPGVTYDAALARLREPVTDEARAADVAQFVHDKATNLFMNYTRNNPKYVKAYARLFNCIPFFIAQWGHRPEDQWAVILGIKPGPNRNLDTVILFDFDKAAEYLIKSSRDAGCEAQFPDDFAYAVHHQWLLPAKQFAEQVAREPHDPVAKYPRITATAAILEPSNLS